MNRIQNVMLAMYVRKQRGATLIEYVLIVAVIAIAVFVGSTFGLGDAITGIFTSATDEINSAGGAPAP